MLEDINERHYIHTLILCRHSPQQIPARYLVIGFQLKIKCFNCQRFSYAPPPGPKFPKPLPAVIDMSLLQRDDTDMPPVTMHNTVALRDWRANTSSSYDHHGYRNAEVATERWRFHESQISAPSYPSICWYERQSHFTVPSELRR